MTQQPTLKKSLPQEVKAAAISSIKIKEMGVDFERSCVIEVRDERKFEAWNVWSNGLSPDRLLKKGSLIPEKEILNIIPRDQPFTIEMQNRDKIAKFLSSRGYTHLLKIIRDDDGSFWFGKPGESMSLLPPIRA